MGNFRMMAIGLALMIGLAYVIAMPVAADRDDHGDHQDQQGQTFVARLSGNEEVPRRITPASGWAVIGSPASRT